MTAPIALTCGEPAGIGPEITVAAWRALRAELPFFWIGDPRHLPAGTPVAEITEPAQAPAVIGDALPVLRHDFAAPVQPGTPVLDNAPAVAAVIARAVDLVQDGAAAAICTNPIHKKVLQDGAGFAYPGHTEYLAALGGVDRVVMMLACDALRVVPVTIHIPLSQVPDALSADLLRDTLRITHAALIRDFGIAAPRIAVAGLNPMPAKAARWGPRKSR